MSQRMSRVSLKRAMGCLTTGMQVGRKKAGNSPLFLVVTSRVASQLENLGGEVLEHRSKVDGCTCADTLGVVATLEHTMDTTDGELETGFRGAGCALGGLACCACLAARGFSGFALARLRRRVRQANKRREISCIPFG